MRSRTGLVATWLATTLAACAVPDGAPAARRAAAEAEAGAPALALFDETRLTRGGDYLDPAWAPDGAAVSAAGARYDSLYLVPLSGGGAPRELPLPADVTAFRHEWRAGPDRLLLRGRPGRPTLEMSPTGALLHPDPDISRGAELRRGDVVVHGATGEVRITRGEDRFLDPVLSPDGTAVAVVGLRTGVHVIDVATGRAIHHGGPGTHPCWTPDGRWVLFERTEDDGEQVTASDLHALSLTTGTTVPLTSTGDAAERHPAVSPAGDRIAFLRDGALWVATLREVQP